MGFINFPDYIEETQIMENPNEEVIFHEGEFTVNWRGKYIKCFGTFYFQWLPRLSIKFKWNPDSETKKLWRPLETDIGVEIFSENYEIKASGIISRFLNQDDYIHCSVSNKIKYGTKETDVDFVRFEIANLRSFDGNIVSYQDSAQHNRLEFINKGYKITIDQYREYMSLKGNLFGNGGYQLLYAGKLESNDSRKLTYNETSEILDSFSYFLIFLNGRRCFPLFRTGWIDDDIVWGDFTPYFNDEYKYVYSWAAEQKHSDIEKLWKDFNNLWQNKSDRDSLKTVLHWYTEANSNTAFNEGSIVLLQNSLELLFHWLISEKLRYVNSNDADSLSASAKIGFLLSQFNLRPEIPEEFESLISYAEKNNIINGAEAFTRIRNCIVHPNHKKRKALLEIESKAKVEALHLGIWYVESILLKYLNYSGNYRNRCKTLKNIKDTEKFQ